MAIVLFPFKIIATIIIFLLIAVIKTANFIIVLILTPLEILGDWLRVIFGIMTAVAVIGLIYAFSKYVKMRNNIRQYKPYVDDRYASGMRDY